MTGGAGTDLPLKSANDRRRIEGAEPGPPLRSANDLRRTEGVEQGPLPRSAYALPGGDISAPSPGLGERLLGAGVNPDGGTGQNTPKLEEGTSFKNKN